jgi:site-specific recombinase XerD
MIMTTETGTINLRPQEHMLEAEQLNDLLLLWLEDCALRLPSHTVRGYRHKTAYFCDWWAVTGPGQDWQLRRRDLQAFAKGLETTKSKQTGRVLMYHTRSDILRRVKQMFKWAHHPEHAYVDQDYSSWVPAPVGSAPLRKATPVDHLRRLMEATELSECFAVRDRAILAVLIGTGVRRAECSSINIEDVQIDADNSGVFKVTAKRVSHREVHERMIAFDRATGQYILAYLDTRAAKGPLFIGRYKSKRLAPEGIARVIERLIIGAGLVGQVQGSHDLRRTFATTFARAHPGEGYGKLLSKQLGHTNYKQTSQYTLHDIEDVRAVLVSPFAFMDPLVFTQTRTD